MANSGQKIFLDVGGHFGETLDEILKPAWRFDVVHCFEPQAKCYAHLKNKFFEQVTDGKLVLHKYGLADFNGERNLYGGASSTIGASLFADKNDIDASEAEKCEFVRASNFVQEYIAPGDLAIMKLNCEGGEVLILRNLMESGAIHSFSSIFIDFDIRKIPSQREEERKLIVEMENCNFRNYALAHEVSRIKTYSLSKRCMLPRSFAGYGLSRIYIWLVLLNQAQRIRHFTLSDKILRCLPKSIWGRIFRIKRTMTKLRYKIRRQTNA